MKADKNSKAEKSVEFPAKKGTENLNKFATIHRADINNARVNQDGSLSLDWNDYYDFERLKNGYNKDYGDNYKNTIFTEINNTALEQQEKGKLTPYMLSKTMNLSAEEIEELLERRRKCLNIK